ncbi:MAG: hypothetical protein KBI35_01855 [Ruminococcus sp.]|nr:hypothetical protein [Ruminococcus sp.]
MKRMIKEIASFSTFECNPPIAKNYIGGAHIYVTDRESREVMADDIFEILNTAYDEISGFKSFKDMERFISDSYLWYITYDGPQPIGDLDINKVLAVSVFRKSHGLKMVGMAANRFPGFSKNSEARKVAKSKARFAIQEHIRFVAARGWAEVSGRLEVLFEQALPWSKYSIMPEDLIENKVFKNISIDVDGVHYYRPLRSGEEPTRKIAYGTIRL